jgi:hypothetical protein
LGECEDLLCLLGRLLFFNFCHNVISFFLKTFQSNELFEGKNTKLMKDKKLEANLSMVASRVMAGLNMNGLKFLLPLWLGALTGVTVRCVFAAVAFWITSWFVKEAPVTRRQRIGLFCLGAFGLYGFMFCYLLGISKTTPVSSAIFNSAMTRDATILRLASSFLSFISFVFFPSNNSLL